MPILTDVKDVSALVSVLVWTAIALGACSYVVFPATGWLRSRTAQRFAKRNERLFTNKYAIQRHAVHTDAEMSTERFEQVCSEYRYDRWLLFVPNLIIYFLTCRRCQAFWVSCGMLAATSSPTLWALILSSLGYGYVVHRLALVKEIETGLMSPMQTRSSGCRQGCG